MAGGSSPPRSWDGGAPAIAGGRVCASVNQSSRTHTAIATSASSSSGRQGLVEDGARAAPRRRPAARARCVARGWRQNRTPTGPRSSPAASKYSRLRMPADAGHDVARHRLDGRVQRLHRGVEELPGVGDLVLGAHQLGLQLQEVLVRLEVRVGLGEREQPAQGLGQHVLLLGQLAGRGAGLLRVDRALARGDDGLERGPLVRGVALDGLDQVGDQVVTPRELDVDLRPGRLDLVALPDELVERRDAVEEDRADEHDDDQQDHHHQTQWSA